MTPFPGCVALIVSIIGMLARFIVYVAPFFAVPYLFITGHPACAWVTIGTFALAIIHSRHIVNLCVLLQASTQCFIVAHILLFFYHAALLSCVFLFAPSATWWILSLVSWVMAALPLLAIIGFSDVEDDSIRKPQLYDDDVVICTYTNFVSHMVAILSCAASVIASICLYVYYN